MNWSVIFKILIKKHKIFYILHITFFTLGYKPITSALLTPTLSNENCIHSPAFNYSLSHFDSRHFGKSDTGNTIRSLKTLLWIVFYCERAIQIKTILMTSHVTIRSHKVSTAITCLIDLYKLIIFHCCSV